MSASMDEKLKRRKLDALKRGVHRLSPDELLPVSTHIIGIGKSGIAAILAVLRNLRADGPKISALALDIGDQDMSELRSFAAGLPIERAEVAIVPLSVPKRDELLAALQQYPNFLQLEYPQYYWAAHYEPWLGKSVALPASGSHFKRAVAKAIYGQGYYSGLRPVQTALRKFASEVEATRTHSVVAIVFGLGGGTGSGIAVDLARHLSNSMFGRRVLVAGIGIAPCDGDASEHRGANLFSTLNELDCLADEAKNRGVVASCGELFRNPFTAGFIMVPQHHVWEATGSLEQANLRTTEEIATLITSRGGASLWETLRLLNWVAAPSTQHSAARTPWGPKWIHMLGFADMASGGPISIGPTLPERLGLVAGYHPEFIEARVQSIEGVEERRAAGALEEAFHPDVPVQLVDGGRPASVQFVLPSVSKTELRMFRRSRALYDAADDEEKLLDHAMLLDQGVVLNEPSTQLEGMAGGSIGGSQSWIAVPMDDLRGQQPPAPHLVDEMAEAI